MLLNFILLLILLIFSGFFSATETAFTSLSVMQRHEIVKRRGKRGAMVEKLSQKPDILLTTILIGNNLVNIAASALATMVTIELFGSHVIGITTGILTLIVLIFAEVTPKRIAIERSREIALATAYPVWILSLVLRPFIVFISLVSSGITRFFSRKKKEKLSLEGLLHLLKIANAQGVVQDYEDRLVRGVFRFNTITAGAIMTHRTEVFSLDQNMKVKEALPLIHTEGYSRIPVYSKNPENITGVVLSGDLVMRFMDGDASLRLKDIARPPLFIPESRKINELFMQFHKARINLAVVLDEYGGLAGVVSREDVIEELVGELYDENESVESEKIIQLTDTTYRVQGDTSLLHIYDVLNLELEHSRNVQTIAGYISETLGRIPHEKEEIPIPGAVLQIESVTKNRIQSLTCRLVPAG